MPPRRKTHEQNSRERDPDDTPTLQDDADILAEAGAEPDEETGELSVSGETVRELGAVDATSVRENRRLSRVVQKKREGKKDVPFNTKDVVVIYGTLLQYWTPDSIDITAKRMLGGATTMLNKPINGAALYEAIMHFHGQHAEAEYEIKFTSSGKYLGLGRITMPDTRPAGQQVQPGPQPYYQPNGAPPPQQQPWQPQAVQPPPQAAPQAADPMAMMTQMFKLLQQMQAGMSQPQAQPQFQSPPAMSVPQVVPTDPMAMMTQMFEMLRQMQGGATTPVAPQPVVVQASPSPQQPAVDPMAMMTQMFDLFHKMQSSMRESAPRQVPRAFDPQGGERPPYTRPPYASSGPPQLPQRPPTMAEQFRASLGDMRSAVGLVHELESILPSREQETHMTPDDDDDSPVRVIDTGHAKIVVNKSDGSTRLWETGLANMPEIFKWVGEQRKEIQEEARQRRQQQPRQQLRPGFVEVGPGYQPPPGYVAVAVEQQQEDELPPPPSNTPPPIEATPRAAWGAPTIPSDEQEQ